MSQALDELLSYLSLSPVDDTIFLGETPNETRQRVFGGLVASQALLSAGKLSIPLVEFTRCTHISWWVVILANPLPTS